MKAVPWRKTDIKDAEWIADLLMHGLLKASFIVSAEQRELGNLTCYHTTLIQGRSCHMNRLQKVLEDANIKLAAVVTDVMGKTGRSILQALVEWQEYPERLVDLTRGSLVQKRELLVQALRGHLKEYYRFLLRELLGLIDYQGRAIERLDRQSVEHLCPFEEQLPGTHQCGHRSGTLWCRGKPSNKGR